MQPPPGWPQQPPHTGPFPGGYPPLPAGPYPGQPGEIGQPAPPVGPPAYPGYPGYAPYGAEPPAPPNRKRSRRLVAIVAVVALLVAGGGATAIALALSDAGPVTAEEQALVGNCVKVTGDAVSLVACSDTNDGTVRSIARHYGECPAGTSAFRLHPNSSNEHSGCYSR